jgi:hypothetical protein
MKEKIMERVSFSKFFPRNQNFIVISGEAKSPDDFWLSVDIGDGHDKASFTFTDWNQKNSMDLLRSMQEAMQEALKFYEKALNLPSQDSLKPNAFEAFAGKKAEAAAKKPAAKKAKKK